MIGSAISLVIMLVHLCSTVVIAKTVMLMERHMTSRHFLFLSMSMMLLYIIIMFNLFICAGVWAGVYYYLDLVDTFEQSFYSALVNYTTLGFGDLLHGTRTRLFGPIAAANGILMFSWAAATLVYVLQRHLPYLMIRKKA